MQAIVTKYIPATNFKGSRIKASCEAGSVTISYPHELNWSNGETHGEAVKALLVKLGWAGVWQLGAMPTGGYCAVRVDGEDCCNGNLTVKL